MVIKKKNKRYTGCALKLWLKRYTYMEKKEEETVMFVVRMKNKREKKQEQEEKQLFFTDTSD